MPSRRIVISASVAAAVIAGIGYLAFWRMDDPWRREAEEAGRSCDSSGVDTAEQPASSERSGHADGAVDSMDGAAGRERPDEPRDDRLVSIEGRIADVGGAAIPDARVAALDRSLWDEVMDGKRRTLRSDTFGTIRSLQAS